MPSANALILTKRLADAYFTGSFKFMLVSSLPSESDFDTFDFRNDVTNEVAASGTYVAGGSAITCTVGAVDTTNNRVAVTWGNPAAWTGATISAVGGWIYKAVGSAATDDLIGFVDFGATITSTNATFTVTLTTPTYINR
jgi:hypothetical protein